MKSRRRILRIIKCFRIIAWELYRFLGRCLRYLRTRWARMCFVISLDSCINRFKLMKLNTRTMRRCIMWLCRKRSRMELALKVRNSIWKMFMSFAGKSTSGRKSSMGKRLLEEFSQDGILMLRLSLIILSSLDCKMPSSMRNLRRSLMFRLLIRKMF